MFAYPDLANHGFYLKVIYLTLDILVVYQCNVKFENSILHIICTVFVKVSYQSYNKQPLISNAPLAAFYFSWLHNLFSMNFEIKYYVMQFDVGRSVLHHHTIQIN
jgi:hypothetical protein